MIEIKVANYCESCLGFAPQVSRFTSADHVDHIISCKHEEVCRQTKGEHSEEGAHA